MGRPSVFDLAFLALTASPLAAVPGGDAFVERAAELGFNHEYLPGLDRIGTSVIIDWLQSGLALGDIDGDGDLDVIAAGALKTNSVYLNDLNQSGTFIDFTAEAGLESAEADRAPTLGDIDRDGDLDLFLGEAKRSDATAVGTSRLYLNDGTGRFEPITTLAGTRGAGHTAYGVFFDVDRDGLLDLATSEFHGTRNKFYRNNGDGTFSDVGQSVGLATLGSAHVTSFIDSDADGTYDAFVGNDYIAQFWANLPGNLGDVHLQGLENGNFLDVSAGSGYDIDRGIMGLTWGDFDYDGDPDVYKADFFKNWLMINEGWPGSGQPWVDEVAAYGVPVDLVVDPFDPTQTPGLAISWAVFTENFDLDPWFDLICINGHVPGANSQVLTDPSNEQNFYFAGGGPGAGFAFTDTTAAVGLLDYIDDRGAAVGDMDLDGDLDLFVAPLNGQLRYYENQLERAGQGWVLVDPICQTSAPGGAGSVVRWIDSNGYPHTRWIGAEAPTASQNDNRAFFGIGNEPSIDLTVTFPSGINLRFDDVAPNTRVDAVEPELLRVSSLTVPVRKNPDPWAPRGTGGVSGGGSLAAVPATAASEQRIVDPNPVVVTVFAHTSTGVPLGPDANVQVEINGFTPMGPIEHVAGNEFRRRFQRPTITGFGRVSTLINGWSVGIRPRVHVYGAASPPQTTWALSPQCVRAGSSDTYTFEFAPKDSRGVSIGAGHALSVRQSGQGAYAPMTDLGNGLYTATFSAPATPGAVTHDLIFDGVQQPPFAPIQAAGTPAPLKTVVYDESPPLGDGSANYGARYRMRAIIRPLDDLGLAPGPEASYQVLITPNAGTAPVTWRSDIPYAQDDGDFLLVLERPPESAPGSATGTLQLLVDGVTVHFDTYVF